jgi:hypothetical protein
LQSSSTSTSGKVSSIISRGCSVPNPQEGTLLLMKRIAVHWSFGNLQNVSQFFGPLRADDGDDGLQEQAGDGDKRGALLREVCFGFGRICGVSFCKE